jgi:hypothetical protein
MMIVSKKTEPQEPCFHCGKIAQAYWAGNTSQVYVCHVCAVNILPKLIADSLDAYTIEHTDRIDKVIEAIQVPFWKAITCRLTNRLRHATNPKTDS